MFLQVFDLHAPLVMLFIPYDSTEPAMPDIIIHPVCPGVILAVAYRAHKMQVRRVDAQRVVTPMIQLQAVENSAVKYAP